MSKPIVDKAEVSIDFPDKYYQGSFGRQSRYDVQVDERGVHISLARNGEEKRRVAFHLQHHLFGEILDSVAEALEGTDDLSDTDREQLNAAADKLKRSLK